MNIGQFDLINEISILNCVQSWFYVLSQIFNESINSCDVTDQEMYGWVHNIEEISQLSELSTSHDATQQTWELCVKSDGIYIIIITLSVTIFNFSFMSFHVCWINRRKTSYIEIRSGQSYLIVKLNKFINTFDSQIAIAL